MLTSVTPADLSSSMGHPTRSFTTAYALFVVDQAVDLAATECRYRQLPIA